MLRNILNSQTTPNWNLIILCFLSLFNFVSLYFMWGFYFLHTGTVGGVNYCGPKSEQKMTAGRGGEAQDQKQWFLHPPLLMVTEKRSIVL